MESDDLTPTPPSFDTTGWVSDVNDELTDLGDRLKDEERKSRLMMIGLGLCALGVVATGRITMQALKLMQEFKNSLEEFGKIPEKAVTEARKQTEPVRKEEPLVNIEEEKPLPPMRELDPEEVEALKTVDATVHRNENLRGNEAMVDPSLIPTKE